MRHSAAAIVFALVGLLAVTGCGGQSDDTPVACLEGTDAYLGALRNAPAEAELGGEVPISDCLAENQTGGDLAAVGTALLKATTELNAEAREEPGGEANLRLGYLIGATERGAEKTAGIHAELIRRLQAAAGYSPGGAPLPPAFQHTYREGLAAGRAEG